MSTFLLASLPIIFLIIVMTMPRPWPSPVAFVSACVIASLMQIFAFAAPLPLLGATIFTGLLNALTPISIVIGAILFFVALEHSGAMARIKDWLHGVSPHPVAQLMIVGWSFMFLLEGASGFGPPAALAAPILVGLGFPALRVAVLCLVFNATPTPFGAVGTPLWFGFEEIGLGEEELLMVGLQTALWQGIVALFLPIAALLLVVDWSVWRRNLGFALLSVAACTFPMMLLAWVNYEFPTVIGGSIGLTLSILAARWGIGLEKTGPKAAKKTAGEGSNTSLVRALLPVGATVLLLLVTRIPGLGLRRWLTSPEGGFTIHLGWAGDLAISSSLVLRWTDILGEDLRWSHAALYVPSLLPFFLTATLALLLFGKGWPEARQVIAGTGQKIAKPLLALFGALVFVNLLSMGGEQSPTMVIGQFFARAAGDGWVYFAPFLGALGSFFSGSTTISNLTFGPIQHSIAQETGISPTLLLALQCAGGSMGNMICIHNIVAVCAVLGLTNKEGTILKMIFPFLLLHGALLALLTLAMNLW